MTTAAYRKTMIEAYSQTREPDLGLSSMFVLRKLNRTNAESVVFDIKRSEEEVAPVVHPGLGPNLNESSLFTTKEITPPGLDEATVINISDLMKRVPGMTEYDSANLDFQVVFADMLFERMGLLEDKLSRNREWQASQILQTASLNLTDKDGNVVYTIDYLPKVSHFPTAGIAWNLPGATILADIDGVADAIRNDGKRDADRLIMGDDTFGAFIDDPQVQSRLDIRDMHMGEIAPEIIGQGFKRQGRLHNGAYQYDILTYSGRGLLPADSTLTRFVDNDSCIVTSSTGRLDTAYGGVPTPTAVDARFRDILPSTIAVPAAVEISPNIYSSLDGRQTILSLASRPVLIPVGIDTYGCIKTGV